MFGGQVISQAVVSATNCVDPVYGLHVSCESNVFHQLSYSPAISIVTSCKEDFVSFLSLSDLSADTNSATSC